ncbi:hypothetical protein JAAARDRAFT_662588 [Jaapia argillacea MUCL 33604]|uniref:Uncharacterized protein n=1 Tax=Jaapia argillacea MUCL 33604 TaxID=933084 RepID=A0A067P366_9AGAM|nr:hypothetical protein JAAARDRAFT_662588 [Jaapia argillacea MUCL 33604]
MLRLLAKLQSRGTGSVGVRHMYLSYIPPRKLRVSEARSWTPWRLREGLMGRGRGGKEESPAELGARYRPNPTESASIVTAATSLLSLTSPTLLTLTLIMPQNPTILLPRSPPPLLQELSLDATYQTYYTTNEWEPPQGYRLPALRKLYIAERYFHEEEFKALVGSSPGLTHLRLVGVEGNIDVEGVLGPLSRGQPFDETDLDGHSRSLQTIIIQPRTLPRIYGCGNEAGSYVRPLHALQRLQQDSIGVQVIFLPPRETSAVPSDVEAKMFWKDSLVSGGGDGRGCWNVDRKVDVEALIMRAHMVPSF